MLKGDVLIVNAQHLRIEWLEGEKVLKKTCTGYVPSDALRPAYEAVLACFQERKSTKVYSDNRQMWPTGRDDLEWIERDWLPRMLKTMWRSWAVLEPETSLGAMNVRRWISLYREHGIDVEVFQTEEAALAWLRSRADAVAEGT
jgi:hypothetical protein